MVEDRVEASKSSTESKDDEKPKVKANPNTKQQQSEQSQAGISAAVNDAPGPTAGSGAEPNGLQPLQGNAYFPGQRPSNGEESATVGRVVHYFNHGSGPFLGLVCGVNPDGSLNLATFDQEGRLHDNTAKPTRSIQHQKKAPADAAEYWTWPPRV